MDGIIIYFFKHFKIFKLNKQINFNFNKLINKQTIFIEKYKTIFVTPYEVHIHMNRFWA